MQNLTNKELDHLKHFFEHFFIFIKDNLRMVVEAVQISVDQIYEAFSNPEKAIDPSKVTDLIPFPDYDYAKNNQPLFQLKEGEIHRRSDINNLQDTKTITDWWGTTTAICLKYWYNPQNSAI